MANVNRGDRPLSPHLSIYRPQLTSVSSIMVRITGIGLLVMSVLVIAWLLAAASSQSAFAAIDGLLRSWFGDIVLTLAAWGFFYHMLGRLRHLIWDLGYCIEIPIAEKMAIGMFSLATILTIITVIVV